MRGQQLEDSSTRDAERLVRLASRGPACLCYGGTFFHSMKLLPIVRKHIDRKSSICIWKKFIILLCWRPEEERQLKRRDSRRRVLRQTAKL